VSDFTASRVIVSGLVRRDDDYLFIRQEKAGGAYPGTLHIPGGGLEPGETPDEGVVREVREEVGIEVSSVAIADFDWDVVPYKGTPTLLVFLRFTAEYASGTPAASSDAAEIVWVPKGDLGAQPHNPPSVRLLTRLGLL
jgi:8-oxo-dGTP diphosphatase